MPHPAESYHHRDAAPGGRCHLRLRGPEAANGWKPMDASVVVKLLGGIGLFLLGIHHLTEGLKGLSGDSLRRTLQRFVSARFSAVASGALLTVATQSSTATILTVIGFVGAGLVTLPQAIAVNIRATLGKTSTTWTVAILAIRFRITTAA